MLTSTQSKTISKSILDNIETKLQSGAIELFIDADEVVTIISEELSPGDVFSESELEEWAEKNGFTRWTVG